MHKSSCVGDGFVVGGVVGATNCECSITFNCRFVATPATASVSVSVGASFSFNDSIDVYFASQLWPNIKASWRSGRCFFCQDNAEKRAYHTLADSGPGHGSRAMDSSGHGTLSDGGAAPATLGGKHANAAPAQQYVIMVTLGRRLVGYSAYRCRIRLLDREQREQHLGALRPL